jgi:hypothetical protein
MSYIHLIQIVLFTIAFYRSLIHLSAILMLKESNEKSIQSASKGIVWCTVVWSFYYMTFYLH